MLFLTCCLAGCNTDPQMDNPANKALKIEQYWAWFQQNSDRFKNFQSDPGAHLNELIDHIGLVSKGLAIELEPPRNGVINMTISANGDRDLFPLVQAMIAKAPQLEGWHFYAFRQRISKQIASGLVLQSKNHRIDPATMRFEPIVMGDSLAILIYAPGVTAANKNGVLNGALILLDNILGEYDTVTKIQGCDVVDLPPGEATPVGLLPLLDLAEFVDRFHAHRDN